MSKVLWKLQKQELFILHKKVLRLSNFNAHTLPFTLTELVYEQYYSTD